MNYRFSELIVIATKVGVGKRKERKNMQFFFFFDINW